MSGVTRSIWFRPEEDADLRRYADLRGTSYGYVVRMAVRLFLGLPVPIAVRDELRERLAQDV